jgi:hypothetical protein
MEIGRVNGIRAISLLSVQRSENAAPPIFEIDASARADDEAYSSSSQTPDRGLEGDEFDFSDEEANRGREAMPPEARRGPGISLFA